MGLIFRIYEPFVVINEVEFFSIGTVSDITKKSNQTIRLWDMWSDERESNGDERLIPASHRIGKNRTRCWSENEIKEIIVFNKRLKYGDIAEFSRTRWGSKSDSLVRDRSTESRLSTKQYRDRVNKDAKRIQNQNKVDAIKAARGSMIKTVRRKARSIIESSHENN